MTANPNVPSAPPGDAGAVEVTLSAEQASVHTVRIPVEVVTITRRIVTDTVHVPVQVRREELVLTRTPVPATDAAPSGPTGKVLGSLIPEPHGDLVIVLRREVPVVTLDIEATERVTVGVTTVTGEQTIRTDLRRERAEITTAGDLSSPDSPATPT